MRDKTMKKNFFCVIAVVVILMIIVLPSAGTQSYSGKKVLYVNSYHRGYGWSDDEQRGAEEVLTAANVRYEVLYMDTKNNPSEAFCKKAALRVKNYITEYEPDVLIVADDSAFKYLVMPYYRDASLPVVFCGINWDISEYDAPYSNTTGMVEYGFIEGVYKYVKQFSRGDRVGFLGPDVLSEHKNAEYYGRFVEGGFDHVEFAADFETWKKKFIAIQQKVDMLIFPGPAGIQGWDAREAGKFGFENLRVPIGTESDEMMPFCLIGVTKTGTEQGEYAARCALRILDGELPSRIPVAVNKKGNLMVNLRVADKLNIILTPAVLRNAKEIYGMEEDDD